MKNALASRCPLQYNRLELEGIRNYSYSPYLMGEAAKPACKNCKKSDNMWSHFCQFQCVSRQSFKPIIIFLCAKRSAKRFWLHAFMYPACTSPGMQFNGFFLKLYTVGKMVKSYPLRRSRVLAVPYET